ncbi:MAG: endo-1,4-beta-xylanase, partial [Prevotella sp.]|nr:endo-1,4-beta-xylanase [Candidatus Prevotella equi]
MNKITTILLALLGVAMTSFAETKVVQDFESYEVGATWTMWNRYGGTVQSTAVVAVDPQNPNNKVLKVTVNNWNEFPQFVTGVANKGPKLTAKYDRVSFCFMRPDEDVNDYKQMHVLYGSDVQYDSDGGYPYQGDKNVWQKRTYAFTNVPATSTATSVRLGIHCDKSVYYLDDVMLYSSDETPSECFEHMLSYESQELNICTKNTANTYAVYTTPTAIPEGTKLDIYTSRYTDLYAPFYGSGTMNIYSGGERTWLGEHNGRKYADWSKFTGDVHIYKYNKVEASAGFYGLIFGHNGKTFIPEDVQGSINEGKACNALAGNRVFLHDGAAMAFESGTRAAVFGELNTDAGSRMYGYYKNNTGQGSYYIVGLSNTDATLAGTIKGMDNGTGSAIGLIKLGTGTYTVTANDNIISAGIRIYEGRVNVSNDVVKAQTSKLSGGTGVAASGKASAYIYGKGILGGTGNIASTVDNYGVIAPGDDNPGTLYVKNFASATSSAKVVMHPKSVLRFKLRSAEDYSQLIVANGIERSVRTADFDESEEMPVVRIELTDDCEINAGDQFVVLTAANRVDADNWYWRIKYPSRFTWRSDEIRNTDGTYSLRLTVTSLDDDPANAGNDDEEDIKEETITDEVTDVTFGPDGDTHTLRYYADQKGMRIGVAVPTYSIPLDNYGDNRTKAIKDEFNMVVNENELKWDSCEPSQNNFNYGGGDALLAFAQNNNMYMRGHTLAWHSQVASWVSSDGKKNDKGWTKRQLLDILKNHIMNVVGHYKGRIKEWDVVNECLDDDQSIVRTNPNGYTLRRQSVWTTVIGEEFIDSAFVWAHQADPDAKLYLNDYGQEVKGSAKTEAFYNLAKRLVKDGRPIDGVGFQTHLDAAAFDATKIGTNIARYAPLGLECTITELDLGVTLNNDDFRQKQARDYYRVVREAMAQPHCRSVLIWGLYDALSWRSSSPLPWDYNMNKKPAYYAVRQALAGATAGCGYDKGDVNHDGMLTVADANAIANHVLGLPSTIDFCADCADADNNGTINIADA